MSRCYFLYSLASRSKTLYVGVTNDLERRINEHKDGSFGGGLTSRYNIRRLVYYEEHETAVEAIAREKQIKGWLRGRKIELIESFNPEWDDLTESWYTGPRDSSLRSE